MESPFDVLARLWELWAETGESLNADHWNCPTRLPGWSVKTVFAHHSQWTFVPQLLVNTPEVEEGPKWASAEDLLRHFNQPEGVASTAADGIAQQAIEDSEAIATDELITRFASTGQTGIRGARSEGSRVVDYFGQGAISTVEAMRIGVLEATVHLLDVQRALDQEPNVPASALVETRTLLAAIPPSVEFIEAATGRVNQAVFPVLR